jgi:hypothetical protein
MIAGVFPDQNRRREPISAAKRMAETQEKLAASRLHFADELMAPIIAVGTPEAPLQVSSGCGIFTIADWNQNIAAIAAASALPRFKIKSSNLNPPFSKTARTLKVIAK